MSLLEEYLWSFKKADAQPLLAWKLPANVYCFLAGMGGDVCYCTIGLWHW